jgi:hypothetical protein
MEMKVAPLHSYKYIAAVQNAVGNEEFQTNPLLIRIDVKVLSLFANRYKTKLEPKERKTLAYFSF